MLETLKREVCDANLKLVEYGLGYSYLGECFRSV